MATAVRDTRPAAGTRLLFIDNIRWTVIVLVICHHAAVTYSHLGSWYYLDGPAPSILAKALLGTFLTFNQAWFMGFLFLIAGYFVPAAYDSKGVRRFLRDRAIRLGIPSAFYMFVIDPLIVFWLLRKFYDPSRPSVTSVYGRLLSSGSFLRGSGPMWFAVALLIFSGVYACVRLLSSRLSLSRTEPKSLPLPTHAAVIALILLMGVCSFLVRIFQPIGTSLFNMQSAFFSQYILLFVVGIMAYRGDWLLRIEHSFGLFWLRLARAVGVPAWFILVAASGALKGDSSSLLGGLHWQSAAFCFWEAFFCLGMCLGLTVIFRRRFNRQGPLSRWMSTNSFSAYLFHPPLLIAVTLALREMAAPPLLKFVVASILAVPLVFIVSALLRQGVPGLRRLL